MPLPQRRLRVTFELAESTMVFDETTEMNVSVTKDCLNPRPTATIELFNLSASKRTQLFTQFTEWNLRMIQTGLGEPPPDDFLNKVKIEAGYKTDKGESIGLIFQGEIVTANLTTSPPNIGMQIQCAARQIDRSKNAASPDPKMTFAQYVDWAGKQMGITRSDCQTTHDNETVQGMFDSVHDVASLIWEIQAAYRPLVVAYVDNDILTVRESNKPLRSETATIAVEEFIGVPMMTSYGVVYQSLFDQKVHLGGLVTLNSKMNPTISNNTKWLVFKLEYTLSSRNTPFYQKADVYPAAK
jgi:hypothetical protein